MIHLGWCLYGAGIAYCLGALMVLAYNLTVGPITLGLAALRALVWPIWILTGRPRGQVRGPD